MLFVSYECSRRAARREKNMTPKEAQKHDQAVRVCRNWEWDSGRLKNAPKPTRNQALRAAVSYLVNGHPNTPLTAFQCYGMSEGVVIGWNPGYPARLFSHPSRVVRHENGVSSVPGAPYDYIDSRELLPLWRRYCRRCNYVLNVRPQWQSEGLSYYADNSVEETFYSPVTGQRRTRMVTAPSGDACF
jgi:hypothetical protein